METEGEEVIWCEGGDGGRGCGGEDVAGGGGEEETAVGGREEGEEGGVDGGDGGGGKEGEVVVWEAGEGGDQGVDCCGRHGCG